MGVCRDWFWLPYLVQMLNHSQPKQKSYITKIYWITPIIKANVSSFYSKNTCGLSVTSFIFIIMSLTIIAQHRWHHSSVQPNTAERYFFRITLLQKLSYWTSEPTCLTLTETKSSGSCCPTVFTRTFIHCSVKAQHFFILFSVTWHCQKKSNYWWCLVIFLACSNTES